MPETRKMLVHMVLMFMICCRASWSDDAEKPLALCGEEKEVIFLLDSPKSIYKDQFQTVLSFVIDMIDRFEESNNETRIAVVILSVDHKNDIKFDTYHTLEELKSLVRNIGSSDTTITTTTTTTTNNNNNRNAKESDTSISAAIAHAESLFSVGVAFDQIMICVTNVVATSDNTFLKLEEDGARDLNQKIIAIGVGGEEVREGLKLIATEDSRDFIYSVEDFQDLSSLVDPLSYSMCLDAAICRGKPLQVVFLLHNSSSAGAADFGRVMDFTKHIVTALDIGPNATQVAAVAYGQDSDVKLFLNRSITKYNVLEALQEEQFPSSEDPKINLALTTVKDLVFRAEGGDGGQNMTRVVIVVTNGSLHDLNETKKVARDLKNEGVEIIVIGVGGANSEELESIASMSANQSEPLHFEPAGYSDLSSIQDMVVDRMCQGLNITYVNATIKPEVVDTTPVNVQTKAEDTFSPACRRKSLEVVFVLHNSTKVGAANSSKMIDFTKHIVSALDIGPNATQVAAVTYGQDTAVQLFFNRSNTKHMVLEALQGIHFTSSGSPNTSLALTTVKDSVLGKEGGDGGENTSRVVIVITKGPLQDLEETKKAAQDLKNVGVKIIAIGVGGANPEELKSIASMPVNQSEPLHFEPDDYSDLSSLQDKVIDRMCQERWAEELKKHEVKQVPSYKALLQYAM